MLVIENSSRILPPKTETKKVWPKPEAATAVSEKKMSLGFSLIKAGNSFNIDFMSARITAALLTGQQIVFALALA